MASAEPFINALNKKMLADWDEAYPDLGEEYIALIQLDLAQF